MDVGHDEPMALLLATLRYGPHVDEGAHGATCVRLITLELLLHWFSVVKSHLVEEMVPVTAQVHDTTIPGQRGWERLEVQEKVWAPAEM